MEIFELYFMFTEIGSQFLCIVGGGRMMRIWVFRI
jgi:hypothetical protein